MDEPDPADDDQIDPWSEARVEAVDAYDALRGLARLKAKLGFSAAKPAAMRAGRYEILELKGSGGFGRVYRARDPKLDRIVALKALPVSDAQARRARRLARAEAQTLASLSHPNIIEIYDVFIAPTPASIGKSDVAAQSGGSDLMLVMPFLSGRTLDTWVAQESPSADAVLEAYIQAAEGLAAAHRAGLIHRDFKPANAMRESDGRVLVLDFGVATVEVATQQHHLSLEVDASRRSIERHEHAGTPIYAAPEQQAQHEVTQAADVFAFGSSLYEALARRPAFEGESHADLFQAKLKGALGLARPPDVSKAVFKVIQRALAANPTARWPSMHPMVEALKEARGRRSRVMGAAAMAALAASAVGGVVLLVGDPPCPSQAERVDEVLGSQRRVALAEALGAFERDGGPVATDLLARLDDHVHAWARAAAEACEAADAAAVDEGTPGLRCLTDQRNRLDAAIEVLVDGDAGVHVQALAIVNDLPPVTRCPDVGDDAFDPPPPSRLDEADAIAARIERARQNGVVGRVVLAKSEANKALRDAEALGYTPLVARALTVLGQVFAMEKDYTRAEPVLERAAWLALGLNDRRLALQAMTGLLESGRPIDDVETTLEWAKRATEIARDLGDEMAEAAIETSIAHAWLSVGRFDDAQAHAEQAVALAERSTESAVLAQAMRALAKSHLQQHALEPAETYARKAKKVATSVLGPHHPDTALISMLLASVVSDAGRPEEAEAIQLEAIVALERAYGPASRYVGGARLNRGNALRRLGRLDEARGEIEQALALWEAGGFEDSMVYGYLALAEIALLDPSNFGSAKASLKRAWGIVEASTSGEHVLRPRIAERLGHLALQEGQTADGGQWCARGRASVADGVMLTAELDLCLAEVSAALGDHEEARRAALAGRDVLDALPALPGVLGERIAELRGRIDAIVALR